MVRQTWGEGATDPNEKSRKEELEMKRNGAVDFWKFVFSVVIMCFHSLYFAGSEKYVFFDGANMVEYFFSRIRISDGGLCYEGGDTVAAAAGLEKHLAVFVS